MDVTTIRVLAGVAFVIVLGVIVWRRKRKAVE
jgi:LPXTG-motif cell wall-anchored protein